ncbi:MAG: hypothetical protein IJU61_08860 [Victivallales bacterium]|nr:hypothetical protein [Victivallales bacterium]
MKLVSLLLVVFSCIAIAEDPPRVGERLAHGLSMDTPAPGRNDGRIYYYVPPQLDLTKPAGLFIFLHGGSSSSKDNAPQSYISGGLKRELDKSSFILAMPSAPPPQKIHTGHRWNYEGTYKSILATIEEVAKRANIDRDRIIFGGVSMGGYGAYHMAELIADRLAGIWLVAGAWTVTDFSTLSGTSVYITHGRRDTFPSIKDNKVKSRKNSWTGVSFARAADKLMTQYGVEHVYDETNGGHGMLDDATARFFSWAANQRRQPYAKHVVIVSPCGTKHPVMETVTKSRWLEAIDVEKGSIQLDKIHLKGPNVAKTEDDWKAQSFELEKTELQGFRLSAVNEGGNTFRVKAEHVRSFRILLSPQMADLSKTIKVEAGLLGVKFLKPQPLKDDQDYTAQIIFNAGR